MPSSEAVIQVDPNWICIKQNAQLWADTSIFELVYGQVQGIWGQNLTVEHEEAMKTAVNVYQGNLLEGWYQEWCIFERERFQQMLLNMLDKLMIYCEAKGRYEIGQTYGMRILRFDPVREQTHRRMMRFRYLSGDRTGALRQYEHCRAILVQELEIEPAEPTRALYEQIRSHKKTHFDKQAHVSLKQRETSTLQGIERTS